MKLKPNQTCPYSSTCKYHNNYNILNMCQGTNALRDNEFICSYVNDNGQFIEEGQQRNSLDLTGKMKFISE